MDEKDAAITEKVLRTWRVVEMFYVQIVMGGGGGGVESWINFALPRCP